jgi:hypothetical protein
VRDMLTLTNSAHGGIVKPTYYTLSVQRHAITLPYSSGVLFCTYEVLWPKDTSQLEAVLHHEHHSHFQDLDALMVPSSSMSHVA